MLKTIEIKTEDLDYVIYADGVKVRSFNQMSDDWAYTNARNHAFDLLKAQGDSETKVIIN